MLGFQPAGGGGAATLGGGPGGTGQWSEAAAAEAANSGASSWRISARAYGSGASILAGSGTGTVKGVSAGFRQKAMSD